MDAGIMILKYTNVWRQNMKYALTHSPLNQRQMKCLETLQLFELVYLDSANRQSAYHCQM